MTALYNPEAFASDLGDLLLLTMISVADAMFVKL